MRTAAAEFTGTFFVVLVPGLLLMQGSPGELAAVAVAAIYAAMAAANHPGGHFHPAVSLAAWMAGRIGFGSWVLRVAAQAAGAAAAGAAVAALFGRAEASFSPEPGRALLLELAFIFALCWVFLRTLPGNPGLPA
ncbi:MAG: hypothetical protein N2322_05485, partial [Terrimicrobiaceae bacterium]|nr:hypothetical protein [Terrimicrobiaceae bacterium]